MYADFRAAVLHILGTDMTPALQPPQHGEWPAPSMDPNALPMAGPPSMPMVPAMAPGLARGPPGGMAYPPVIWVIGECRVWEHKVRGRVAYPPLCRRSPAWQ